MKVILFLVGLTLLALIYWRNRGHMKGQDGIYLLSATIFFAISFVTENFLPKEGPPDYVSLHRPYLEPTLIVDSTLKEGVTYHYTVLNRGKLPARQIVFSYEDPNSSGVDNSLLNPRELASDASMLLPLAPLPSDHVSPGSIVSLHAFYQSTVLGKTVNYHTKFRFQIPNVPILGAQCQYLSATRYEGEISFGEQMETIGLSERLKDETGSYLFWLDHHFLNDANGGSFFSFPERSLEFDPNIKKIVFRHINTEGKEWRLVQTLGEPKKGSHFIGVTWCPTGACLFVDDRGVQVCGDEKPSEIVEYAEQMHTERQRE